MRVLQYSQPRSFFSPLHNPETRAFKALPKPDTLKADCVQWPKPEPKAGGSVKFSGWYHPAMSLEQVRATCSQASIDDTDFLGNTALILATKKNKPEVVQLLLEKNANINHQNQEKRTALMEASRKGHGNLVQLLLVHGANPAIRDAGNQTAQDLAANNSIKKQIQNHLRAGEANAPQQRGGWGGWIKKGAIGLLLAIAGKPALEYGYDQATGTTPLMKVAKSSGNLEEAKSLIYREKINPVQKDVWGNTAQHYAEQKQHVPLAQYLKSVRIRMINEMTQSAASRQKDKVHRFLAQGIDINAKDRNGNTALINAVKAGDRDMVDFLLEQGAYLRIRDKQGKIAFDYATDPHIKSAITAVQQHLDHELVDVFNCVDTVHCPDIKRIKTALDKGANPNARFQRGITHLMVAASRGDVPLIQTLTDAGADVNLVDDDGDSALMLASANGHKDAAIALLDADADPCLKNGKTLFAENAYDRAKKFNHVELAEYLHKVNKEKDCYNPSRFMKEAAYTTVAAGEYSVVALTAYQLAKEAITALAALA